MEKEIVQHFLNKYVKLERLSPSDDRPFKLYGIIKEVTNENLLLHTEKGGLGAIRLQDIISIVEWRER